MQPLSNHAKTPHSEHTWDKLHQCNRCEYETTRLAPLKKHMKAHSATKMHNYSCIATSNLKIHMIRMHTAEKPFKFNQCNYAFTGSGILQSHMKTHTLERPFKCSQCDRTFRWKIDSTRHSSV